MAKKQLKNTRKKGRNIISHLQLNELPNAGRNYFAQGKFAEAIKIFRRLMLESEEQQWTELLLSSFKSRINQLTAKGMYKEALVIFNNMQTNFPAQDADLHILLLIQAKQLSKALQQYEKAEAEDTLTAQQKKVIDETFAALLLSGQDKLVQNIAPTSSLRVQFPYAQQALHYYSQGQDSEALACLQHIPFRSPYKNFSLALKGMLVFHNRQDKAQAFFDKLDVGSPFMALVSPYLQVMEGRGGDSEKSEEVKVIQLLQGLDTTKLKFIASLNKHGRTPAGFMKCLLAAGTCLDSKQLRHLCYRLLAHEPSFIKEYERKFGGIKDKFEYARLQALAMDIEKDLNGPEMWYRACKILVERNNAADSLKIALLHRHIAELMCEIDEESTQNEQRKQLEKSLLYDPNDKETWLTVHQLLHSSKVEQYRWVNKMLDIFPDDPDVLSLGVETAVKRNAFKKASRLAGKLLKLDPINTKVRELLIGAHLNHAHKLAQQKKYALACQECVHASGFDRVNAAQGRIEITHGLIQLLEGKERDGQILLDNGAGRYKNQQIARLHICLDAELLLMPQEWKEKFTTGLKALIGEKPEKNVLLQMIASIPDSNDKKQRAWQEVRVTLLPYLKKGAQLPLHQDEFMTICKTWYRQAELPLLHLYGKEARQLYPNVPLFQFYTLYGKTEAGKKRLSRDDCEVLDKASQMAMKQKDSATERLIESFLEKNMSFGFPGSMNGGLLSRLFEEDFFDNERGKPSDKDIKKIINEILLPW